MKSTPCLELRFRFATVKFALGDSLDSARQTLAGYELRQTGDPEIRRVYLQLVGLGTEMIFQDGKLSAIFLYLSGGPSVCGTFRGTTDLLSRKILEADDPSVFARCLEAKGFMPPNRTYPYSIDRLNHELRIRLTLRDGERTVGIDDGRLVR